MQDNHYHFVTRWRFDATTIDEVADVLTEPLELSRWWPAVYLGVEEISPGDAVTGVGAVIGLYTKGWLPYSLRWQFRVTENQRPRRFALEAWGDVVGRGVWTLAQDGAVADVVYDWRVRADKALLRRLSPALKPVFAANHRWAMRTGEASLRLELARRRARTLEERARIGAPPRATFAWTIR